MHTSTLTLFLTFNLLTWNLQTLTSGLDTNLRALSSSPANDTLVLWASGNNGVVLRSPDAGKSWNRLHIDNADTQDFRGIRSFGADIAYIFSVGNDNKSHIYKTVDAGRTWRTQYSDPRPAFFLDGLVCRSEKICFAISDPIDGKFPFLHTEDGEHWTELPPQSLPSALPTEGLFAASNSSLILCGPSQNDILFATGGPAARVFHSTNDGHTWSVVTTPILSGNASAGIFSIACDDRTVIAVGGDYRNPAATRSVAAYSTDLGATWHLADQPPAGYRSAVTPVGHRSPKLWIAVGTTGADTSADAGVRWSPLNRENANAVVAAGSSFVLTVGPKGAVKRIGIRKQVQPPNQR